MLTLIHMRVLTNYNTYFINIFLIDCTFSSGSVFSYNFGYYNTMSNISQKVLNSYNVIGSNLSLRCIISSNLSILYDISSKTSFNSKGKENSKPKTTHQTMYNNRSSILTYLPNFSRCATKMCNFLVKIVKEPAEC